MSALIDIRDVTKTYEMGAETIVHALDGVSLSIEAGDYVAIMGPSGSGKSTLMNLIGCLDTPSTGSYVLKGREISSMNDDELAQIRNKEIGFIFQTFNLLPRADAVQNVELPLGLFGAARAGSGKRGPKRRSTPWVWGPASTTGRTRCRAASASASRSRAPRGQRPVDPARRRADRATSTPRPARRSSR